MKSYSRIMITTVVFLLLSQVAEAQTVTKVFKNATLKSVLEEIESQTGFSFVFNSDEVDTSVPISANFEKASLETVLSKVLSSSYKYSTKGKMISISPNTETAKQQSSKKEVFKGTVISSDDSQPIIGAGILIQGTTNGVVTDINGEFEIPLSPNDEYVIFNCLGYDEKILKVEDLKKLKVIVMDVAANTLDDVVVVGFGSQKKESLVGAVQAVKPKELKVTSSNLSTSFAGKIAGVISVQKSGEPGVADGANFWIRGISTFGSGQTPLYILDGVEITAQMLNNIPPESIESFSILKDATATSLYGSRGANGVMIITTKSGRNSEKMAVNVRAELGGSGPTIRPYAADGVTFMETFNEALIGRNKEPYYSQEKIDNTKAGTNPYLYPNVDWYSMLFKDSTFNQNFNVNMTGGGKKVDYFMNVSIFNENGIIRKPAFTSYDTNINSQKYLFQANVNAMLTNTTKVSLKMNTQLQLSHQPSVGTGTLFSYCMSGMPAEFAPVLPGESTDTFVRFGTAQRWTTGYCTNPYAQLCKGYEKEYRAHFTSALSVDQNLDFITKGLKASAMVSFYNRVYSGIMQTMTPFLYTITGYSINPDGTYKYDMLQVQQGNTYMSTSRSQDGVRELTFQAQIDYNRTFAKHTVGATLVYHQKEKVYNIAASEEYASLPYRQQGIAGRITYDFNKRYLFETNFGYNGSENFAPGHRFGFFPSVALGWAISNEPFFRPIKNDINLLKIRASYGLVGNDVISSSYEDRFPYLSTVNMNYRYDLCLGPDLVQQVGPSMSVYGNPEATWETSKKLDVGLELGLFNSLNLIVDYFNEHRSGIFMQRTSLPSSFGLSGISPWGNTGKVDNEGFDISLDYNKAFNKDLILSLRGTFTYAHNTIAFMDEPIYQWDYQYKTGHSINSYKLYVFDRYFIDEDDIRNSPDQSAISTLYPLMPGDMKYKDLNNDGKIDANDMKWVDETSIPQITYGFGGTVSYKHFDLSIFFQGLGKYSILMENFHPFSTATDPGTGLMQYIADSHWTEQNPDPYAFYPRLSDKWNDNNTVNSTHWLKDGSFLRLKSAEFGYTWKIMRVYLSGTNLLTFSKFKFWDPEIGGGDGLSYPIQRTYNFGIQLNF